MSVDKKILDRIEKLLKLGNPRSNNSVHECQNAAMEACKLIAEHDLVVRPREVPVKKKSRRSTTSAPSPWQPSQWGQSAPPPGWARSIAARDSICADPDCQGPIYRGDKVWAKITGFDVTYLHLGADCGW